MFPSLRRGKNDKTTLLETLGGLYSLGRDLNWNSLYAKKARVVQLPPYPWNRKPYWIQTAKASTGRVSKGADSFTTLPHFIAGHRIRSKALTDHVFEFCLSPHSISFLGDHIVFGEIVLPAPVLMEMCFSAASQAFGNEFRVLEDFRIHRGIFFSNQQEKTLQVILKSDPPNSALFEVLVLSDNRDESNSWDTLASGKIRTAGDIAPNEPGWQNIDPFKKIKNFSRDEIPGAEIYMKLSEKGVQLGPLFRSIESIWLFERESFAKIRLPEQLKSEQRNYRIHPVLMDGSLQLVMAGLLVASESTEINAPYLFVGLDSFQQYAPPGPIVFCRAELTNPGQSAQELISGDITLVDEKGACIAEIKGVCLKKATRDSFLASREQASETSIFQLVWYPAPLHAKAEDLLATSVMPSPVQIYEKLSGIEIGIPPTAEHDQANTLSDELDLLCTAGIVHCFRQLGWQMALGSLVARDMVDFKLGVADRHRRLFDRMMGILKEDGILKIEGVNWKVVQEFKVINQEKALSDLIIRHPEHETELKLLGDCLRELPGILRCETEPMNLLFPGGSIDRAEKLYQDSPVFRNNNELAGKIASIIRSFVPENRILNVLEIGAGTGGTTGHILPVFTGNRTKYVFTDVSNFFLDKIKKKFSKYPFLSYQLLDIEKNLSEQSIPQGRFDLVIASNVLHATADLKQTLRNTLQLITPDGLLLLIEGVRAARWIDMIFGLTSGWWLFSDTDLRTNHPLISRETWLDVLRELNFREPLILSARKSGNKEIFEQAVILAQAPKAYQERPVAFDEKKTRINSEAKKDHWLVFCGNSPVGRNMYAALEERGIECTLIYPEQVCGVSPNGQRSVGALQIEYFKRMISDLRKRGNSHFSNAVFLWGIDTTRQCDTIDDIEGAATFACSSLACIVNTFLHSEQSTLPRIWIVTQGAHSLQNFEKPCLSQAPLWGMGRVLSAEHPDLWGGMIDLDPESTENEAVRNMLAQILSEDGENQVSFRSDQRYVPSLSLCEKFSHQSISFSQEKSYLITGGLGALGLKTALWMAEAGARKLILLGRTLLPERSRWSEINSNSPHYSKIVEIQRIESLGALVQTASVDVANEEQMRPLLKKLSEDGWRPIHGVVHAAGVIRDQLLHQLDVTSFQEVLRPKMIGAWLLDSLLGEDPLDFFILFSSVGSLLGQKGQASYASANAFLDAVASYRRAKGQPALCINWGPWAGAGLAVTVGANRTIQNLYAQGIESLSDSEATQAIGALLQGKITQGAVIGINWKKFQRAYKNGK